MKKLILVLSFLTLTTLFNSCSSTGVSVVDFSPRGEIKNLSTFTVEFSRDLAPQDMLDKWLDDEFIKFEPKIEGKYKWTSARTLIFSPDVPLQPIQSYKAEITGKVLFDKNYSLDSDTYKFNTPDFDAMKAEFFYTHIPGQQYRVSIKANLYFNYAVNPGMLRDYLTFDRDGGDIKDYKIISENSADVIAVDLGEVQQSEKDQQYRVTIKSGLMSVIGKKGMETTRVFKYDLPPLTRLAITGIASGLDGDNKWIEVYTTQRADEKRIKDFVKTDPRGDLNFSVNDNSFRIEGKFPGTQVVNLTIEKGLPGLYGGELAFDFEQQVSFVNLSPSLNFTDKRGKYLMLSGEHNLELSAVNIPAVDVEISQVYKNNALYFIKQNNYSGYEDYGYDYYYPYYNVSDYGHSIYKEKIKLKDSPNSLEKFSVNLDKIRSEKLKGLYVIEVRSTKDRWRNATKMLSLSDLGIIAKKSRNQLMVFVNSIATTKPVADVQISLISSTNQLIVSGKTNSDGIIKFDDLGEKMKDFSPRIITAETSDDFNLIDLPETRVETSRFDVGGQPENTSGYKSFIYGDRNIYRPGEQVNVSGIVRDEFTKAVKNIPVIIKVIAPTGKTFDEFKKNLNSEGSFDLSFKIPGYAQTGQYRTDIYTGSGSLIGSYTINIEDFVPDKVRVLLKNDKKEIVPGQTVNIDVSAEFLFGGKAAGLKYQADIQLRHKQFVSKKYSSYNFGNSSFKNPGIPNTIVDGTLDENGKADISFNSPADLQSSGIIAGYAFVSVFDLTGRTVNRISTFDVYPQKYFIGLKSPGYYFGTNQNIEFKTVAVDKNDNPASNLRAEVKLVRTEWQTVLKRNNSGHYVYASEKKEITEWRREMDLSGGEKNIPVNVERNGEYELRISKKGSDYYQAAKFYAYNWYSSSSSSFEVDKEGRVEIVFDKTSYEPGEKAKVLFTTPFAGRMLVTIERAGVYDYKYVDVKDRSTQVELNIDDKYIPNVYVTATLFRAHTANETMPFLVAHGFASMTVERKSNRLPVTITAPAKIKPNRKIEVTVKTVPRKNVYVTLAAVDEGILQIKNYATPDPYGFMYAKRALSVGSFDLYKLLLPEIISIKSSTGGDMLASQLQKRVNPVSSQRFKLLAVWSGILKTDADGEVKVPVNIPQFNGEVRLMAVAYNGDRFGSGEAHMKVSEDLIMEPQVPRFLAPGDSLVMPVTLINTTDTKGGATVNIKVEGPLSVRSSSARNVSLDANSTGRALFVITTENKTGAGKIKLETTGLANVKDEYNISVRPVSPYFSESASGVVENGSDIKLATASDYMQGTASSTLTISKFPALKFAKFLKYLVGYPYGCVEQTVSKIFPQLYFEDLAMLVAPEYYKTSSPVYFVNEGIRKLASMQLPDGSLSYWPGGSYSSWWGSVYAAHFLVEAKKAGFNVNENMLNRLLNYIGTRARKKSTYDYVTYKNNSRTVTKIANKEILYSLYVLAAAGRGDISTMNYYKAKPHLVSADSRYLLAGAYALMNQWNSYYEIIPKSYSPENTDRLSGGNFDSGARANAIMLNVLVEVDPSNSQIPFIIRHLAGMMDRIYSTQDRSFAFLALGKASRLGENYDVNVDVYTDGKKIGSYDGKDRTFNLPEHAKSVSLKGSGKGKVYYFQSISGVKNGSVKEKDSHISVRRSYFDYRTGLPVTNNNFTQGQLVICKITLAGGENSAENVVITDLLPSGFEIDNPRLSATPQLSDRYKGTMRVQYMDVRDDRMILFTNAERLTTRTFYYLIRVVNKGDFVLPVIGAEAMYDPEISSLSGAGVVKVN